MNFFDLAVEHAKQYRDRLLASRDPQAAPYVEVSLAIGSATYPRCVLDEFSLGTVTVTSVDSGSLVRVCPPGTWREAKQVDALGYVELSCMATTAVSKPCTHCAGQAWFVQGNADGSVTYQCQAGHLVIVDAPEQTRGAA